MRRLAIVAVSGVVALSQLGPFSSSGAVSAPSGAGSSVAPSAPRLRATALDQARVSLPLPRAAVMSRKAEVAKRRAAARTSRARSVRGDVWAALARCESGGDASARSANGRYTGAFQFSDATWRSLGYGGRAADHPYDVQVTAAKRLQARSGWGQWPHCSRRLGLR